MTRYQLAKIVEWAGTLHSRKRMQKVVYLLKVAGCPLDAQYRLHFYGPYSEDVARLNGDMVQANFLEEAGEPTPVGLRYSYRVPDGVRASLNAFETSPHGRPLRDEMAPFEQRAKELAQADPKILEYAATIAYFRQQGHEWPVAVEKMCEFKKLTGEVPVVRDAEVLAQKFAQ